jgi:hypothetical protein
MCGNVGGLFHFPLEGLHEEGECESGGMDY